MNSHRVGSELDFPEDFLRLRVSVLLLTTEGNTRNEIRHFPAENYSLSQIDRHGENGLWEEGKKKTSDASVVAVRPHLLSHSCTWRPPVGQKRKVGRGTLATWEVAIVCMSGFMAAWMFAVGERGGYICRIGQESVLARAIRTTAGLHNGENPEGIDFVPMCLVQLAPQGSLNTFETLSSTFSPVKWLINKSICFTFGINQSLVYSSSDVRYEIKYRNPRSDPQEYMSRYKYICHMSLRNMPSG
ncbi:hypothetical protein ROHU_014125 [Labeo rohita]|uniref:Uncharacterized protein n=1 Tax=Labeo rohita TaxID=84645 RepID=A0A498NXX2_LABRO|nr:hypothetical protein ROHU_014125 [Labeo rohita]